MEILISNTQKIFSVQQAFRQLFPYLSIEFFLIPPASEQSSAMRFLISSSKTFGECRKKNTPEEVSIRPQMTVTELEKMISENFGIGVQVFRQSGKVWLEATFTDGWTLEQQNSEGEALSKAAG